MLWRALKHVQNGFYIDVGANSPSIESVTKHFYEQNWCGINIEPEPKLHQQLEQERPRDLNLRMAISDIEGEMDIYYCEANGLTTLDNEIAAGNEMQGLESTRAIVDVTTIKIVCEKFVEKKEIHFLKIDVEGLEEKVLLGNDWTKYRPWIVVVEAMKPNSQVEDHEGWEPILLNANYHFVYADGLNRYYVANEHDEFAVSFKYPPNVFDDFKIYDPQHNASLVTPESDRSYRISIGSGSILDFIHRLTSSIIRKLRWLLRKIFSSPRSWRKE